MPPKLLRPRDEVRAKLQDQIGRARSELLNELIQTNDDYRRVGQALTRWRNYVVDLLGMLFSEQGPAEEFSRQIHFIYSAAPQPVQAQVQELHKDVDTYVNRLQSLLERVELYEEAPIVTAPPASGTLSNPDRTPKGTAVFIVHGRAGRESEVARAVEHLGLEAVILQERLHRGSATLVEKLEREARPCGYALVVFTGDDEGRIYDSGDDFTRRARENVVLELGYFVGLLGRDRVTILRDPDVTVPSDFHGVGYYDLDTAGAWKDRVKGELRRVGLL